MVPLPADVSGYVQQSVPAQPGPDDGRAWARVSTHWAGHGEETRAALIASGAVTKEQLKAAKDQQRYVVVTLSAV